MDEPAADSVDWQKISADLAARVRVLSRALERAHERNAQTPNHGQIPKKGPPRSVSIDEIARSVCRSLAVDPQPVTLRFWPWENISMKERECFRRIARAIAQEFWTVRRKAKEEETP